METQIRLIIRLSYIAEDEYDGDFTMRTGKRELTQNISQPPPECKVPSYPLNDGNGLEYDLPSIEDENTINASLNYVKELATRLDFEANAAVD